MRDRRGGVAASAPVFSAANALYAALSMVLMGYVVDMVVDGGNTQRAAFIISDHFEDIEHDILHAMDRGCIAPDGPGFLDQEGPSGPVLRAFPSRDLDHQDHDADAMLIITDVNEAIGYGFKSVG